MTRRDPQTSVKYLRRLQRLFVVVLIALPLNIGAATHYHCADRGGLQTFSDYPLEDQVCTEMVSQEETEIPKTDRPIAPNAESPEKNITRIAVKENGILVPVTLGYDGREADIRLVLDTGASATTIYDNVAGRLLVNLNNAPKAQGRVAGGGTIDANRVTFSYLRIGPNTFRDWNIFVLENKDGDTSYDGLLGMDVLSTMRYKIDFKNQIIIWE